MDWMSHHSSEDHQIDYIVAAKSTISFKMFRTPPQCPRAWKSGDALQGCEVAGRISCAVSVPWQEPLYPHMSPIRTLSQEQDRVYAIIKLWWFAGRPSICFPSLSNAKTSAKEPTPAKRTELTRFGSGFAEWMWRVSAFFCHIFAGTLCTKAEGSDSPCYAELCTWTPASPRVPLHHHFAWNGEEHLRVSLLKRTHGCVSQSPL